MQTTPLIVTHGGAGGPKSHNDGCEAAARVGLEKLASGGSALDATVAATVVLEDDPRLNAGTGSNLRLDGVTLEMDAAVMDHKYRFGGVGAIQRVKNPVLVARQVMDSPHLLLVGDGATRFARAKGIADHYPISDRAKERFAKVQKYFSEDREADWAPGWSNVDPSTVWNFPTELREALGPSDTVGAVARDASGGFAAGLSTGGTSIMLLGRVGDTPLIGAGLYAGPHGAVAATGDGEEIMRRVLAKEVYDQLASGVDAQIACDLAVGRYDANQFTIGIIAVSLRGHGVADNRTMPSCMLRG